MANAPGGEIVVFEAPNGEVRVDVRLELETVWSGRQLLQKMQQFK